ncbi:MAG: AAA family ATPase [Candidatus Omnitrophota bacterium]
MVAEHKGERYIRAADFDAKLKEYTEEIKKKTGWNDEQAAIAAKQRLENEGIYRIHQDFRIFATMNPSEYAGRQVFSPALLNRFRVKWIDEPDEKDIRKIFREKYSPELKPGLIDKMTDIHFEMIKKVPQDQGSNTRYTIRHLIRWMDRVVKGVEQNGEHSPEYFAVMEGESVYADLFSDEDETHKGYKKELRDMLTRKFGKVYEFDMEIEFRSLPGRVGLNGTSLPKRPGERKYFAPGPKLVMTGSMKRYLHKIARAVRCAEKVLLSGLTGGGKSDLIRYLSDLTNNNFMAIDLDGQSDVSQLVGHYVPEEGTDKYKWEDGILIRAMRDGAWLLIDEINLAEADIIERINSLLDDDGSLTVNEHKGEKWVPAEVYDRLDEKEREGVRRIHPDFRLFAAMNPDHYAGRTIMSEAMLNKFYRLWISQEGTAAEETSIAYDYLSRGGKLPDTRFDELAADVIGKEAESAEIMYQSGMLSGNRSGGVYLSMFGAGAAQELLERFRDWREKAKQEKEKKRQAAIKALNMGAKYFKAEKPAKKKGSWLENVRKNIGRKKVNSRLSQVQFTSRFYSGDMNMNAEPGEGWAIRYEPGPPTFIYPEEELEKKGADYVSGAAMHETGHRDISWIDKDFMKKPSLQFLQNAIEDPRVNNWMKIKVPGSKPYFDAFYQEIYPESGKSGRARMKDQPLNLQFGYGLIHRWYYNEDHPGIEDEKVIEALNLTRPAVEEAYNTLAGTVSIRRLDKNAIEINSPAYGRRRVNLLSTGQKLFTKWPDIQSITRKDENTVVVNTSLALDEEVELPEAGGSPKFITVNLRPGHQEKKEAAKIVSRIIKERVLPEYQKLVDEAKDRLKNQKMKSSKGGKSGSQAQAEADSEIESKSGEEADKLGGQIGKDKNEKDKPGEKKDEPGKGEPKAGEGESGKGEPKAGEGESGKGEPKAGEGESGKGEPKAGEGEPGKGEPKAGEGESGKGDPKAGEDEPGKGERQKGKPEKPEPGRDERLSVRERRELDRQLRNALKDVNKRGLYNKYYNAVYPVVNQLFGILDNELHKDKKFRHKGDYLQGPKLNTRKAMTMKRTGDMKIWKRRAKPTKRSFKFCLVLDESGSMSGKKAEYAVRALVVFMEVLSRLDIDFSIIGFSGGVSVHKPLNKQFRDSDKDELIAEVIEFMNRGGSTNDADAVDAAIGQLDNEASDSKAIVMLTDGEGNVRPVGPVINKAREKGIEVIGVGIGEGMGYVKEVYEPHAAVDKLEDLPMVTGRIIKDMIEKGKRTPVTGEVARETVKDRKLIHYEYRKKKKTPGFLKRLIEKMLFISAVLLCVFIFPSRLAAQETRKRPRVLSGTEISRQIVRPEKNVDSGFEVSIGLLSRQYDDLKHRGILDQIKARGVNHIERVKVSDEGDKKSVLAELERKTVRRKGLSALLEIDENTPEHEVLALVDDLVKNAWKDIINLRRPDLLSLNAETIKRIKDTAELGKILDLYIRIHPNVRSLRLSEKSLYCILAADIGKKYQTAYTKDTISRLKAIKEKPELRGKYLVTTVESVTDMVLLGEAITHRRAQMSVSEEDDPVVDVVLVRNDRINQEIDKYLEETGLMNYVSRDRVLEMEEGKTITPGQVFKRLRECSSPGISVSQIAIAAKAGVIDKSSEEAKEALRTGRKESLLMVESRTGLLNQLYNKTCEVIDGKTEMLEKVPGYNLYLYIPDAEEADMEALKMYNNMFNDA